MNRWRDLSRARRGAIAVLLPIEFALTSAAAVDLWMRPRAYVRGRKALWWPALLVQPIGPIAYLALGRRPACKEGVT